MQKRTLPNSWLVVVAMLSATSVAISAAPAAAELKAVEVP